MTLDAPLRDQILASVEAGFDEQLAFTQEMIRLQSLRGAEHSCQDFVFRALRARGFAMDRFAMDRTAIEAHPGGSPWSADHSDAPIVVGTHYPQQETGRSLILQAHVDVVPTGPDTLWTHAPFDPVIEGDWLYGRGGADMKAGHAANLFCLDALHRIGFAPAATVHIQSVVEEESTGNGALMTYLRGYQAEAVLIPEPEEEMLVRANVGVLWFQVELRGLPKHVREMGNGANAIDAAYRVIAELRQLEAEWNAQKGNHEYFGDLDHPINLNIGKIEGGDWASSVPAWCRIDCRISLYPGITATEAAEEIRARVERFARADTFLANALPEVTFNGFHAEGYVQPPGTEAEAVLARAHEGATGDRLQSFVTPGYLDTRVYALYNRIPSLCYGPISENIHGFDERVSLRSLKRITGAMALFVAEWCGLERIEG
ncbi:ArgE/DapE family deacylase [Roseovarius sp.]|uniref:ArgE/DapE family deacylase n=1 Tax=Roseovarius sp. TaxID=1486281 RepID=UPI000C39859F|nr:ArgE/DapE family deacylase [Roseovarius sp.]MAO25989.1 acetylornithine deacetylase [Roseovarius sp.]MAZ20060.1 acetylornithine deacetylase [Roseovarius sp.]